MTLDEYVAKRSTAFTEDEIIQAWREAWTACETNRLDEQPNERWKMTDEQVAHVVRARKSEFVADTVEAAVRLGIVEPCREHRYPPNDPGHAAERNEFRWADELGFCEHGATERHLVQRTARTKDDPKYFDASYWCQGPK